jgi:hypothetical protein
MAGHILSTLPYKSILERPVLLPRNISAWYRKGYSIFKTRIIIIIIVVVIIIIILMTRLKDQKVVNYKCPTLEIYTSTRDGQ